MVAALWRTVSLLSAGLSLRDTGRRSAVQERLRVESLLLHVERRQMEWFGDLRAETGSCDWTMIQTQQQTDIRLDEEEQNPGSGMS